MKTLSNILDPHALRARVARNERAEESGRDRGFSLIEIMAGMAIIAILALAIIPQFNKYFERAAVQNLSSEVSNAALLVEADFSLTGAAKYKQANVVTSVAKAAKNAETTLVGATPAGADSFGYTITGTNPGVTCFDVKYGGGDGGGLGSAGLKVTTKSPLPAGC